ELVPAREARTLGIDEDRELVLVNGRVAAVGILLRDSRQRFIRGDALDLFGLRGCDELLTPVAQARGVLSRRAVGGFGDQLAADQRRRRDVSGIDAALEFVAPRGEVIDPRGHGVAITPEPLERELAAPAV